MKKINLRLFQMGGIPRLFERQNVCVCGMMGSGKDVLFGNVIARIRRPYISNLDYGGDRIVFKPWMLDFNNNWKNLMTDSINRYEHLFPDGYHMYLSDLGLYLPAQFQGEITKLYPNVGFSIPMFRQVAGGWLHGNAQTPNRIYDKIREHFDIWISCRWCKVLFKKIVIQYVVEYERYQSCVDRVPPFPLRRPLLNPNRIQQYEIQKANYLIAHGRVRPRLLIYKNKSKHDTRAFKEMFANAKNA